MTSPLDLVLERLQGVKKNGSGHVARCPAHEDHRASLSISTGDDGRVLLHCHAGCTLEAICAALQMQVTDLFADSGKLRKQIVAEYDYVDENGALLFQAVRFEPKDFRQRRRVNGEWVWNLKDVRRVLYRLPQVIAAAKAGGTVYVVEGEKDVHAVEQAGALATTSPAGAGKWRPEYSAALSGAHVIVVSDRDGPGYAHAAQILRALSGVAATCTCVRAKVGKDTADHLAAGHSLEDLEPADPDAEIAAEARRKTERENKEREAAGAVPTPESPAGAEEAPSEGCSDTGNAARFIRLYGDRVRWCDIENRWYTYDGRRWSPDDVLQVQEWMRCALQTIYTEAARTGSPEESKKLGVWALRSMSASSRRNALECAKSDPRVAVHPRQFDRGPYHLNCKNGTLDLLTGHLHKHDPRDLLRRYTGVAYLPHARSRLWERVVYEAVGQDEEFAAAFQRACGYSVSTSTEEEVFFIMHGPTRSVKSTVCDALSAALGDYVKNGVSAETWLEQGNPGGNRGDLVDLDGVRMAISAEATHKTAMATALLKAFTGGDPITASQKYMRAQTMIPTAKIWLHTNEIPRLPDDDEAIWRRAVVFPFKHPPAHPDPEIKKRLKTSKAEHEAVLAWTVQGFMQWRERGIDIPRAVVEETTSVRFSMDPLRDWWEEYCIAEEGVRTSNAALRESYDAWRKAYNVHYAVNAKDWGTRLRARGLEPYKSGSLRGWVGVRLADADAVEQSLGGI